MIGSSPNASKLAELKAKSDEIMERYNPQPEPAAAPAAEAPVAEDPAAAA